MNESQIAQMEGEMNRAEDEYFEARPSFDHGRARIIFRAGFQRGYKVTRLPEECKIEAAASRLTGWQI